MMMMLTYSELFAGAGGLSLGLDAAGFHAAAHAEIEPHARAVLRYRWPDTRLDGDVTKINGADYAGITLLSGGSPCQDLSVAGKRAGLSGSRSSLFYEQCRIWRESNAPYLLWENVGGALSSNHGADFATVLSTIVGSTVAVPADGWRGGGGVVAGREAVAAWRVLDLQHFGPPQRRVRVFVLAARAGGVDPAEVLALSEGVCGHPSPRQQSRKGVAASTNSGVESGVVVGWDQEINAAEEMMGTLKARVLGGGHENGVLAFDTTQITSPANYSNPKVGDPCHPLASGAHPPAVIAWDNAVPLNISNGVPSLDDTMGTLDTDGASTTAIGAQTRGVIMAFHHTQTPISGKVSPAIGRPTDGMGMVAFLAKLSTHDGGISEHGVTPCMTVENPLAVLCTTGDVTHALTHEGADASEDGTRRGTPIVARMVAYGEYAEDGMAGAIKARDYKDATDLVYSTAGRPRRLTPLECERLMSWPDQWTATGRKDDGAEYALSDTARYRLCGNGVGSVCAEWIAKRLHDAIQRQEVMA